jgi:hypothetical protein
MGRLSRTTVLSAVAAALVVAGWPGTAHAVDECVPDTASTRVCASAVQTQAGPSGYRNNNDVRVLVYNGSDLAAGAVVAQSDYGGQHTSAHGYVPAVPGIVFLSQYDGGNPGGYDGYQNTTVGTSAAGHTVYAGQREINALYNDDPTCQLYVEADGDETAAYCPLDLFLPLIPYLPYLGIL